MPKQTLFGADARHALQAGVDAVVNAVKQTLGPRGRNVLLDRPGQPLATRDGVTVAKEVSNLPNRFENMGAMYAREVADADVTEVGDGTTTASVIFQAIVREGFKLVDAGAEPLLLADGIAAATQKCVEYIKALAIPATPELVRQVGIVATHQDVELGTIIADATLKVGAMGVIELQESRDHQTTIEHMEGFYFERGWKHSDLGFDDGARFTLERPLILISERLIVGSGLNQQGSPIQGDGIGPILAIAAAARRPLLVIGEGLSGDALHVFSMNIKNGYLVGGAFVKLPGFGDQRTAAIEDLRISCGAQRIHSQTSTRQDDQLSSFTLADLGGCDQAIISALRTTLVKGFADTVAVNKRVKTLIQQSQEATNPWEKEIIDHRIARLTGGVAVLRVGAHSEPAMIEKKARAEDAIHACRGALQDGVVPGGGVALLRAAQMYAYTAGDDGYSVGQELLIKAIAEPAEQIVWNAGKNAAKIIAELVLPGEDTRTVGAPFGFNSATGEFGDMYAMGIVDPAKVVITALTKAASIGALLLTTEVLCTDIPERMETPKMPAVVRG